MEQEELFIEDRRSPSNKILIDRRISERVAVLETQVDNHTQDIEENRRTTDKLLQRLDQHVIEEGNRNLQLQAKLIHVTDSVENLSKSIIDTNGTLKELATISRGNADTILKWDFIVLLTAKIFAAIAVVVSLGWTIMQVGEKVHELPSVTTVAK